MELEYKDNEADETLSLSDLQMDESVTPSEQVIQTFYEDFFGFSVDEYCSPSNSPVKLLVSDHDTFNKPTTKKVVETNPNFRSNSGSFKYMRLKMASTMESWRSKSLSVMATNSKSKSRWQIFMFGSGKFPTKMDLIDIKTRQLRSGSTTNVSSQCGDQEASGGRRIRRPSGKKVWWRVVDFLGCGGGYEKDTTKVVVV